MVACWEEITVEQDTLLELESTQPKYIWILLEGEVSVYKRPESMYDESGNPTDVKKIAMFPNPVDSNSKKLGMCMGAINQVNLLADDAVMFRQALIYSLKTKTRILAWRCST